MVGHATDRVAAVDPRQVAGVRSRVVVPYEHAVADLVSLRVRRDRGSAAHGQQNHYQESFHLGSHTGVVSQPWTVQKKPLYGLPLLLVPDLWTIGP